MVGLLPNVLYGVKRQEGRGASLSTQMISGFVLTSSASVPLGRACSTAKPQTDGAGMYALATVRRREAQYLKLFLMLERTRAIFLIVLIG